MSCVRASSGCSSKARASHSFRRLPLPDGGVRKRAHGGVGELAGLDRLAGAVAGQEQIELPRGIGHIGNPCRRR